MKNIVSKFHKVGIDTNIFTYYLDRNSHFYAKTEELFTQIARKNLLIITSVITLTELLSFKASQLQLNKLEQEFLLTPNLEVIDVGLEVAKEAARIRREYGFRLPDSVQLATALDAKAQTFITNDKRLKLFKRLPVTLLTEI